MTAHSALMDDSEWTPPEPVIPHRFLCQISTRTGIYSEDLILRPTDGGQWMRATRVRQGNRVLEEDVDSNWPRDNQGKMVGFD
jgi:hypothetical protein